MERSLGLEQRIIIQKGGGILGLKIQAKMNVCFANVSYHSTNGK